MSKRIFVDVHAIQTVPPSNINRDDTGSPKTAQYGGVKRARVSSQAWKKAMRDYFSENSDLDVGKRTRDVVGYVAEQMIDMHPETDKEEARSKSEKAVKDGIASLGKDGLMKALFFIGKKQARSLAELAYKGVTDKKELKKAVSDNPDIDIALFGRMLADNPELNEDASSQVAHAISTHGVQTEFDYFTALDDLKPEDQQGAAMIDTLEYTSSTLYRYANVAVHELKHQLGDNETTAKTVRLFVEAFVKSLPTGKINSFANQTLPQAVMVNIRGDRPVNLVSAFEDPVKARNGYVAESEDRLFKELKKTGKFTDKPLYTLYIADRSEEVDGTNEADFTSLLNDLEGDTATLLRQLDD